MNRTNWNGFWSGKRDIDYGPMFWFLLLIYAVCEFISPPNILRYNAGIERRWIETYQNKLSGMWYIFADKIFIAFADIYSQDNQEQQYETPFFICIPYVRLSQYQNSFFKGDVTQPGPPGTFYLNYSLKHLNRLSFFNKNDLCSSRRKALICNTKCVLYIVIIWYNLFVYI